MSKKNLLKKPDKNRSNAANALLLVIIFSCPVFSTPAENIYAASEVVAQLHQRLIEVMQDSETLGYQGRYAKLAPDISSSFDPPLIARVILSRYWKKLSEEQKVDFITLFNHLSIATYASRFDAYNDEQFFEIAKEALKKVRVLIKTVLRSPDEEPIRLDYVIHPKNGSWLIINVIAEGVSDLSLKRAEYAAVIKEKGFDGLVKDIKGKIHDMENESE